MPRQNAYEIARKDERAVDLHPLDFDSLVRVVDSVVLTAEAMVAELGTEADPYLRRSAIDLHRDAVDQRARFRQQLREADIVLASRAAVSVDSATKPRACIRRFVEFVDGL